MKTRVAKPKIEETNFYESIQSAIKEGRHEEYLKNVVEEYEEYKKIFDQALTDKNSPDMVYTFHVTYLNQKSIWREIIILGNQTFEKLAITIIKAMGWDNDHMHGFSLSKKYKIKNYPFTAIPATFFAYGWEDDPHPTFKSSKILICNMDYEKYPKLQFEFDFGDSHTFDITYIGIRKASEKESKRTLPKLIDQRGIAPEQYPSYD